MATVMTSTSVPDRQSTLAEQAVDQVSEMSAVLDHRDPGGGRSVVDTARAVGAVGDLADRGC
jgi:hypothetical protein